MPRALPPGPATTNDVAVCDWDALFSAVKDRLRASVCERGRAGSGPWTDPSAAPLERLCADVLDCVQALDQLQDTMRHELDRRDRLALDQFDAHAIQARARIEQEGRVHRRLGTGSDAAPGLAVLRVCLDADQELTDLHGSAWAEEVLRITGARLQGALRREDRVSRLADGGFVCWLAHQPSRAQLSHLACKLFDAVSSPMAIGDQVVEVRPSIGIALGPSDSPSAAGLLPCADEAVHRAWRDRSGYAFFDEGPAR